MARQRRTTSAFGFDGLQREELEVVLLVEPRALQRLQRKPRAGSERQGHVPLFLLIQLFIQPAGMLVKVQNGCAELAQQILRLFLLKARQFQLGQES